MIRNEYGYIDRLSIERTLSEPILYHTFTIHERGDTLTFHVYTFDIVAITATLAATRNLFELHIYTQHTSLFSLKPRKFFHYTY